MVVQKIKDNCPLFDIFIYKRLFKRKWQASSLINPQTHLESVIILDRNISYLSQLQLLGNLAYKMLGLLSHATKKWPGILASTTLLLRLTLRQSWIWNKDAAYSARSGPYIDLLI
jgi:hypothetical protein